MAYCKAEVERSPKVIHDHQTCFACRPDGHKSSIQPLLTPGVFYPKCSLLVEPVDGCEPLTLLADPATEKDRIIAVTKCDIDLTEVLEADNIPCGVYTNIGLDPDYVCWPDGVTVDDIDLLVRNMKGCIWFIRRESCTPVPEALRYKLEGSEAVAQVRTSVKSSATTGGDAA